VSFPWEATIVVVVVVGLGAFAVVALGGETWGNGIDRGVPPVDPPPGEVGIPYRCSAYRMIWENTGAATMPP
jgi:hypothetical protein